MEASQGVRPRPLPIVVLVGAGGLALAAGAVAGGDAIAFGVAGFFAAMVLALGQTAWPVVTWQNALLLFIGVLWFVPIKLYRLPVDLPFHLELYRVLILLLVMGFVVSSLTSGRSVESLGAGKPLFVLTAAALTTQILNAQSIDIPGNEGQALKSLSLFLSLVLVFLLFASTVDSFRQIETLVIALVAGGAIVAVAALYEGHSFYNVFDQLARWVPLFERNEREVLALRGGRLRVHASAQHPIALGAALMMLLPLAMYLVSRAKTRMQSGVWVGAMVLIAAGAAATVSRTTVAMGVAMLVVAWNVRKQALLRLVPLFLVMPIIVHAAAPGAIGGILKSFQGPQGDSLVESLQSRSGESGSGRLADVEPALDLWSRSPIVGVGIDNPEIASSGTDLTSTPGQTVAVPIIFDNQYLHTLVTLGLLGIIGIVWFVWGTVLRTARAARRLVGPEGDFVAACSVACAGYGASMLFFDSIAFIQVTLLLFITAALALKTLALRPPPPDAPTDAAR